MKPWMKPAASVLLAAAAWAVPALALAQAAAPDFPENASTPSAEELKSLLAGKVFEFTAGNGTQVRLQFQSSYVYFNAAGGSSGNGPWRTENGRLCAHLRGRDASCNEVRLHQGVLHLKRDNGEIVQYLPR